MVKKIYILYEVNYNVYILFFRCIIFFFMTKKNVNEFDLTLKALGVEIRTLRIQAGYKSYEVFAWENNLSRIQYWKMEQGTNCTLKSLYKVLQIHELSFGDFFKSIDDKAKL